MRSEHCNILPVKQMRHTIRRGTVIEQPPLLSGFFNPAIVIAIAVKNNMLMILNGFADHLMKRRFKVFGSFQPVRIYFQALCNRTVKHNICTGNAVGRSQHTEFKLIACKSKRRSTITIRSISVKSRQYIHTKLHLCLLSPTVWCTGLDCLQYGIQLISQENRYNCRRRLICPQPVIVTGRGNRQTEQILVIIHRLNHRTQEKEELCIFIWGISGRQKIDT